AGGCRFVSAHRADVRWRGSRRGRRGARALERGQGERLHGDVLADRRGGALAAQGMSGSALAIRASAGRGLVSLLVAPRIARCNERPRGLLPGAFAQLDLVSRSGAGDQYFATTGP